MKKTKLVLTIIAAVAATGLIAPVLAGTAPQPSLLQEKAEKGEPFNGKVEAVNAEGKTLTVGGAAILVTDATKLIKQGKPITLADIKVGDQVHGKTSKNAEGKAEALNVTVGNADKGAEKK